MHDFVDRVGRHRDRSHQVDSEPGDRLGARYVESTMRSLLRLRVLLAILLGALAMAGWYWWVEVIGARLGSDGASVAPAGGRLSVRRVDTDRVTVTCLHWWT